MSLDSEPSPPPVHRDWFFPSAPFVHTAPSARTLNPRRPSVFPSTTRASKPFLREPRSQRAAPGSTFSSLPAAAGGGAVTTTSSPPLPSSIRRRDSRYAGVRRKVCFDAPTPDKTARTDGPQAARDYKPAVRKGAGVFFDGRVRFRWPMAVSVAIIVTCFTSLLHKNFSLHNQLIVLQDQLSMLNARLQACDIFPPLESSNIVSQEGDHILNRKLKNSALFFSLAVLSIALITFKHIDNISRLRMPADTEAVSLSKELAYRVDVFLSVQPYAKPLALFLATFLLICLGGLALFGVTDDSLADCLWLSWTYVADSGNHANSVGIGPKLVSVSISFGGMLIFAMMLGLVSDTISEKFDSLRKGRSKVIEKNHTLILGWSDKLGSLLNQLAIANESLGGGTVVVMAERDKEEMELDISKMEFDFKGTSVICRSGSPLILADLKKVSVSKARAVVVLAEDGNADQSDARALRTVLSLTGVKEGLSGHIVVELSDLDNEVLVKLVGGDLVETVVAHDVIGRLMIQCARQPGLAQIWEDILGFENCEFYIKRWPQLDEMQFEDVLISFPDAIPCGIKVASSGGKIILNPDDSYVLQEGDEILVIAEDDDSYAPTTLPMVHRGYLPKDFIVPKSPERILFCGWRRDMEDMIMVLDAFLAPESELWMFNDVAESEREKKLIDGGLDFSRLENITLVNREGNAVIRRHLESLPLESFDSILILADESVEDSAIQADSRSLATLLLIRDIQAKRLPYKEAMVSHVHRGSFSQGSWIGEMRQASDKSVIISEILDPRTKNLLSMSKISDYVLSNELVSMALAMVAEDRQINDVLEELFAEEGNELQIRPADLYLHEEEEMNFYEIMVRARQRKEIVIGYRLANAEQAIINPPDKSVQRKWSCKDVFVVIAEKE
ncbi:probable ion channel CASTOR isoform X1 [Phoenix dactylifera]|uniref:Probable ion channel CASTOR isoform X1 n=1 Tax=Phoenix dactylifera TaxID=42345 RepID=A0A8B8Z832_PHODC|nr:probable ion channel CASTOR isoform X1 [Phoenix dactylifera]